MSGLMQAGPTLYEAEERRKKKGSQGLLEAVGEPMSYAAGPVGLDDLLEVVTFFRERPIARFRLDYEVFREGEAQPVAEGYTINSFINAKTGRPTRAPAQFVEAVENHMNTRE